jgi:hypothetical protein
MFTIAPPYSESPLQFFRVFYDSFQAAMNPNFSILYKGACKESHKDIMVFLASQMKFKFITELGPMCVPRDRFSKEEW